MLIDADQGSTDTSKTLPCLCLTCIGQTLQEHLCLCIPAVSRERKRKFFVSHVSDQRGFPTLGSIENAKVKGRPHQHQK